MTASVHVGYGSKTAVGTCPQYVRLLPNSDWIADIAAGRFRARSVTHPGCGHTGGDDQELETLLACVEYFASNSPDTDMIVECTFTRDNTSGGMSMKRVSLIAGLLLVGLLPL